MGKIYYADKRIQPAPLVDIQKMYNKSADGNIIGKTYSLVLNGQCIAYKGSPSSSGTFGENNADEDIAQNARLAAIQRKQEALRDLFSWEGSGLSIESLDGSTPVTCNPRVVDINFPEGIWHTVCPYTITLEADELYPMEEDSFDYKLQDASESWFIDTEDTPEGIGLPKTYRLSHTVTAVGKRFYDTDGNAIEAYQHASGWVQSRLGFDQDIALSRGVLNLPSYYMALDHVRSETKDIRGGSYTVTEGWVLSSGTYQEDFTVETNTSVGAGNTVVTIAGQITGRETRDANMVLTSGKYDLASAGFDVVSGLMLDRAQNYSGETLNVTPVSTSISKNPIAGTIGYNWVYDTRPSLMFSGAKSENVSISTTRGIDEFAVIPVISRSTGPVIQNLGTHRECERTLNIEVVFNHSYFSAGLTSQQKLNNWNPYVHQPYSGVIRDLEVAAEPLNKAWNNIGALATTGYVSNFSVNWNPSPEPRFTYNKTWIYE